MDPRNGVHSARAIAERLCALDPEGSLIYKANLEALEHKLWALDQELMTLLEPCRSKPFFVIHPAYVYLTTRYGLAQPQPLILNHDGLLTPKSLLALGEFLKTHPGGFVFFEPQFEATCAKIVSLITEKGGRIAHLDPLGIGRDYCDLLRACAKSMAACLS
jgi:ABC-type Zn2+ transport system substrate-binding protein/surface adhesin